MIRALPSLYSHVREINNLVGYALSTECELSVSTLFYASTTHMFFLWHARKTCFMSCPCKKHSLVPILPLCGTEKKINLSSINYFSQIRMCFRKHFCFVGSPVLSMNGLSVFEYKIHIETIEASKKLIISEVEVSLTRLRSHNPRWLRNIGRYRRKQQEGQGHRSTQQDQYQSLTWHTAGGTENSAAHLATMESQQWIIQNRDGFHSNGSEIWMSR